MQNQREQLSPNHMQAQLDRQRLLCIASPVQVKWRKNGIINLGEEPTHPSTARVFSAHALTWASAPTSFKQPHKPSIPIIMLVLGRGEWLEETALSPNPFGVAATTSHTRLFKKVWPLLERFRTPSRRVTDQISITSE